MCIHNMHVLCVCVVLYVCAVLLWCVHVCMSMSMQGRLATLQLLSNSSAADHISCQREGHQPCVVGLLLVPHHELSVSSVRWVANCCISILCHQNNTGAVCREMVTDSTGLHPGSLPHHWTVMTCTCTCKLGVLGTHQSYSKIFWGERGDTHSSHLRALDDQGPLVRKSRPKAKGWGGGHWVLSCTQIIHHI